MYKFWKKIKENRKNTVASLNFPNKVLIAPLDWGLGHTTRCISIIRYFQQKSCQIYVAANLQQTNLLQLELHDITYLSLEGYNIRYSRDRRFFGWMIFFQVPSIVRSIFRENRWLKQAQKKYSFDIIISDNRYGMYHPLTPSIIITHQLQIRSGFSKITDRILNKLVHQWINRFDECWIPDVEAPFSLAGSLSNPKKKPGNVRYIGPLSRFVYEPPTPGIDLLITLSGPEPQRTIFEQLILSQVGSVQGQVMIVRGLPDEKETLPSFEHVSIINHLPGTRFREVLSGARMVVCRAGYSSIMDLVVLQKKAILVATPGQAEQEYLSKYLFKHRIFYCVDQAGLNLQTNLREAAEFDFTTLPISFNTYQHAIDQLLLSLSPIEP